MPPHAEPKRALAMSIRQAKSDASPHSLAAVLAAGTAHKCALVLDDSRPSIETGVTASFSEGYRKILGIVFPATSKDSQRILVRGTQDRDNEAIVNAAAELSRQMTAWLKSNTPIVVEGGVIYGHGDAPLAAYGIPDFGPVDVNGTTVMGKIEERRNPQMGGQGSPLFVYHKRIYVKFPGTIAAECKPLTMGRGWL